MSPLVRQRYEVLATAGRGGQGTVLQALDLIHQRHVAIKVRQLDSEHERQAVLEEARILFSLRPHPNLPLVREDFVEEDRYCLVMDWIQGRNLAQVLEQQGSPGLSFERTLDYLSQAAEALDHLHDHDPPVVHQDVKPANLILTPDGRVVLVDFGISRQQQRLGDPRGTPDYVAPEVGAGAPTPASDIFSLAVTAYTLLTGAPPRPEIRPSLPGVPAARASAVLQALRRGLKTDPAARPASATALIEAIRAANQVRTPNSKKSPTNLRRQVVWSSLVLAAGAIATAVALYSWSQFHDTETSRPQATGSTGSCIDLHMAVTDDLGNKFETRYDCSTSIDSPVYANIRADESNEPLDDTGYMREAKHVWVVCQVKGRPNPESPLTRGIRNNHWLYTQGDYDWESSPHHGRQYSRAWGYLPANVISQAGQNSAVPGVPFCPTLY